MAKHLEILNKNLVDLALGRIRRLIVQMPPRHGKSELCSKHFPAWYLGWYPDRNVILTSATDDLAMDFSAQSRDLLREHGGLWGVKLREDRSSVQRWQTTKGGGLRAAGVGGGIMGRGADLLIIDDYFKNVEAALSETQRNKLYQWYLSTSGTRLSPRGATLIIATRWHKQDLIGQVLTEAEQTGEEWRVVNFPAIDEHEQALWPEQWPLESLVGKRAGYNAAGYPWMWEALYQQNPPTVLDSEWPEHYFADIFAEDWPESSVVTVVALDPSLGHSDKADYSAFVSVTKTGAGMYYVDANLDRRPSRQIVDDGIEWMANCIRPDFFCSEANQFQELLWDMFEERMGEAGLVEGHVHKIHNTVPKVTRIRSLTSLLAAGRIKLRKTPGTALLLEQLRGFPSHKHDDGPDALEMAIRYCETLLQGTGHEEPQPLMSA